MTDRPDPKELEPRFAGGIRVALWGIEEMLYLVVGLLLLVAAVFIVVGTVSELISAIKAHANAVNTGVVVLDRVLLTLIVAELLHTLRFVVLRGQIVVEPFLFVGLIAVVRRILIITAELERQTPGGRALTNLLLELGLLGFLTLALASAIFLVRRGGVGAPDEANPAEPPKPMMLPDALPPE
ncbi:MAG TPA: phosphate-starvation-inducible PsiE family protein [Solirubrobacteraceae bacterium]|nr:phosphate-starvation-inducible PsiE family protein [Solirubrobacteraceae bacterium]